MFSGSVSFSLTRSVRRTDVWKLYWMRSDLKWHSFEPSSRKKTLEALVKEVDSDPHGAFFG